MTSSNLSIHCIKELQEQVSKDKNFRKLLEASLRSAEEKARKQLDPHLYQALSWPQDFDHYVAYLTGFARWIPRQSDNPAWNGTDGQQEVYDRLCHFYWLIDQEVPGTQPPRIVENIPWFSEWLVRYASSWGSFLDTTESFNETILQSFMDLSPKYSVKDSMIEGPDGLRPNAPSGWLTFNQFFARELNPGLRPITNPAENRIVTAPADCTYRARYSINAQSEIPEIVIKKTHTYASVETLLEGSKYGSEFANGTFVHYFLGPYSYHRFHTPVAGIVRECYPTHGSVYLDVKCDKGQFDAPDSATGGYEFAQARGIVVIDTEGSQFGDIGLVAVVPVGMAQVSSVNMTMVAGSTVVKGDEFGYFLFGGSDIIVLFQQHAQAQINEGTHYRHYGSQIATCQTS